MLSSAHFMAVHVKLGFAKLQCAIFHRFYGGALLLQTTSFHNLLLTDCCAASNLSSISVDYERNYLALYLLEQVQNLWKSGPEEILVSRGCYYDLSCFFRKTDEMSVSEAQARQVGRHDAKSTLHFLGIYFTLPILHLDTFADFPSSSTEMFSFY